MTSDGTNDDRAFEELAVAWRATQPAPLSGLAAKIRRRNRWSAVVIGGEVAVSLGALGTLGWLLSTGPTPLWLVWIAFMGATTVALMTFSIRARAGTWRAERPGVLGLLELSIRQTRSSIRLARGAALATLLVLAFTAGWATLEAWELEDPTPEGIARRAIAYGAVLLYCLGWLLGCRSWIRRKTREQKELEQALADLAASSGHSPPDTVTG
jgi:hypothetical protein